MKTALAFLIAFVSSAILYQLFIPVLKRLNVGQQILHYVTDHKQKQGTPTMGGIVFIFVIVVLGCVFCNLSLRPTAVAIAVFVAYGIVGFLDDFVKIKYKRNQGLFAYQKILFQVAIAVAVALFVYSDVAIGDKLIVPFTSKQIDLGFWIIPFVVFVYLACTNGVNLTDGIDGLAGSNTLCFLAGMIVVLNKQLNLLDTVGDTHAYNQTEDVLKLCYISCGALTGFLLFNANKAKVFMGDTGSLALGALVACVAIFTRMSLFIPILGVMFVTSCVSVILQVVYFKLTGGKRIFLMAPFHHHLQKRGWSESRICVLYCAITVCCIFLLSCFGE